MTTYTHDRFCCYHNKSSSYNPAVYTDSVKQNAGAALDVILIEQPNRSLQSSDWLLVLEQVSQPCEVHIHVNGRAVSRRLRVHSPMQSATFDGVSCAPPEDLLADLATWPELKVGKNDLSYTIVESGQTVRAWLYLWTNQSRVVVFDVDGTITLNDFVGQLGGLLNQSFVHKGVCELLCQLEARGYNVMFLTSRTLVGPAGIDRTRRYLFEVARDEGTGFVMPEAPVCTTRRVHGCQSNPLVFLAHSGTNHKRLVAHQQR